MFRTITTRSVLAVTFAFLFSLNAHAQWVKTNGPFGGVPTEALLATDSGLLSCSADGISLTKDTGQTWVWAGWGDNVNCFGTSGQNVFAVGSSLFSSFDQGKTWSHSSSFDHRGYCVAGIHSVECIGTFSEGIFRSVDGGQSWLPSDSGLPPNTTVSYLLAVDNNFIAATSAGIFLSSDSGVRWTSEMATGVPHAMVSSGSEIVFADDSDLLFSMDGGITWSVLNNGLGYGKILALAISRDTLYAGTAGEGVFVSPLNTLHWSSANAGLTDTTITCFAVTRSDMYAGTVSGFVYRLPLPASTFNSVPVTQVENSNLRAFPNPITHSTTVGFTSAASGYATVSIVNQLGAEVARVFAGELGAGEHSFQWNVPTNLSSGMYECIVRKNGIIEIARLLVK